MMRRPDGHRQEASCRTSHRSNLRVRGAASSMSSAFLDTGTDGVGSGDPHFSLSLR